MITAFYAGLLALLFFRISIETIQARRKHQISLGSGANDAVLSLVSAHNNFASYIPIVLLLAILLESTNLVHGAILHILLAIVVVGRLLHFIAFRQKKMNFKLRVLGMQLTLTPMIALAVLNISGYLVRIF